MIDIPRKGSIEWVALSKYYDDLVDEAEKGLVREGVEGKELEAAQEGLSKIRAVSKQYEGVEFAVKNLGRAEAQKYSLELRRIKAEDIKGRAAERKGVSRETAPELWAEDGDEMHTPECIQKSNNLARKIILDYVDGARGISVGGETLKESGESPEAIADVVDFLGVLPHVTRLILSSQGLSGPEVLS